MLIQVVITCKLPLAVVSNDDVLEERMRLGRRVTDESWIKSSIEFNNWLKNNADKTIPNIMLLDTSNLTPEEAAKATDKWIRDCMENEES